MPCAHEPPPRWLNSSRCSDYTAFLYLGRLIEYGPTETIFTRPLASETEDYVSGRFG